MVGEAGAHTAHCMVWLLGPVAWETHQEHVCVPKILKRREKWKRWDCSMSITHRSRFLTLSPPTYLLAKFKKKLTACRKTLRLSYFNLLLKIYLGEGFQTVKSPNQNQQDKQLESFFWYCVSFSLFGQSGKQCNVSLIKTLQLIILAPVQFRWWTPHIWHTKIQTGFNKWDISNTGLLLSRFLGVAAAQVQ